MAERYPQYKYVVAVTNREGMTYGASRIDIPTTPETAVADMAVATRLSAAFRVALVEVTKTSQFESLPGVGITDVPGMAHPEYNPEKPVSLRAELVISEHFVLRQPDPAEEAVSA